MSENLAKGGQFLLDETGSRRIFTFEDFDEEVLQFGKTALDFMEKDVLPRNDEIEAMETKVEANKELLKKAGEIGLLMVEVPEEYEGLGMGVSASMLISEKIAVHGSFSVSLLCHTGIGTLPIVYFGSDEQKKKYLPKLATGEWLAAYGLTEANFGSDALGAKTKAVLNEEGTHYILNGEKVFITNAGFADTVIVYAKVDGEHFSAFIVETAWDGVSTSPEEHKMGIKGSSTRSFILEDVKVPKENLLGELGKGHKSALGILDIGRLKLGIGSLGAAKRLLQITSEYANERKQFKAPISSFGMIKRKFADMVTKTYALEAMSYRTSGMIDDVIHALDPKEPNYLEQVGKAFKEFSIECSILKVWGSEVLSFVADECVQVHGGYGFIEEYEVAKAYRDARINRIFEGTNEINRLLIPGELMKKAMKGELDLMTLITGKIMGEIKNDSVPKEPAEGPLGNEITAVEIAKRLVGYGSGVAILKYMGDLQKKEFIMGKGEFFFEVMADMLMELYAMESTVLRTKQLIETKGEDGAAYPIKLTRVFTWESLEKIKSWTRALVAYVHGADEKEIGRANKAMTRMDFSYPIDLLSLKEDIANRVLEFNKYLL